MCAAKCQHDSGSPDCCMHGMRCCNYTTRAPRVAKLRVVSKSRDKCIGLPGLVHTKTSLRWEPELPSTPCRHGPCYLQDTWPGCCVVGSSLRAKVQGAKNLRMHCRRSTVHLLLLLTETLHNAGRQLRQQHQQHQVAPGCGVIASQQQAERDVLQSGQSSAGTKASCSPAMHRSLCIAVACCWQPRCCCCGSCPAGFKHQKSRRCRRGQRT